MKNLFVLSFISISCLSAKAHHEQAEDQIPAWNTGPLLCPTFQLCAKGTYNIEPYMYINAIYGTYNDKWNESSQDYIVQAYSYNLIQIGLSDYFNVSLSPQFFYQTYNNYSVANIGDLPLQAYFGLIKDDPESKIPGMLIGVKSTVPLGRYKNLSPEGAVADAIGGGSWRPTVDIAVGKQIHLGGTRFLIVRSYFAYQFLNNFKVQGFNAYGGGYKSKGIMKMGAQYTFIASFEYAFSRHGVFAFDFNYQHNNKMTFRGEGGYIDINNTIISIGGIPSSDQLSIAPALEYNFNANVGLIAGVWFSIAGRNAQAFYCPTFALNIQY
jgi:hypothetical protein